MLVGKLQAVRMPRCRRCWATLAAVLVMMAGWRGSSSNKAMSVPRSDCKVKRMACRGGCCAVPSSACNWVLAESVLGASSGVSGPHHASAGQHADCCSVQGWFTSQRGCASRDVARTRKVCMHHPAAYERGKCLKEREERCVMLPASMCATFATAGRLGADEFPNKGYEIGYARAARPLHGSLLCRLAAY